MSNMYCLSIEKYLSLALELNISIMHHKRHYHSILSYHLSQTEIIDATFSVHFRRDGGFTGLLNEITNSHTEGM